VAIDAIWIGNRILFTRNESLCYTHTLVSTVTSSFPLLCTGFEASISSGIPNRPLVSATATLDELTNSIALTPLHCKHWLNYLLELSWCCDRRSVGLSVLMSGTPLGSVATFIFFLSFAGQLLCFSSWGAHSNDRTGLQFVVQSVSGQTRGGLITVHYCPIWEYWVLFPSPLTIAGITVEVFQSASTRGENSLLEI
jgi:hypothetical protein